MPKKDVEIENREDIYIAPKSTEELVNMIHKFVNDPYIQYINERTETMSIMEIYGVNRKEHNHSDFLAWLFDSSSDHNLGTLPVDKLIKLLASKKDKNLDRIEDKELNYEELLKFLTNSNTVKESSVYREESNEKGRVDIILCITAEKSPEKIRVVFENKIAAPETNGDQTSRYYDYFTDKSKNDEYKNIFVYNRYNKSNPICDKYICITYQDITDDILEPLLQLPNISERTKFIIKDYILGLEKPVNEEKGVDKIVMALGNEAKKLLTNFWKNNFELINLAIEEEKETLLADFWESNAELISKVATSLLVLEPHNEDYKKFAIGVKDAKRKFQVRIKGGSISSLSKAGEKIISDISCNIKSIEDLRYIFNHKNNKSNRVCEESDDFYKKHGERRFSKEPIEIEKKRYFLRKEWTGETFINFLNRLKEKELIDKSDVILYEIINGKENQIFPTDNNINTKHI